MKDWLWWMIVIAGLIATASIMDYYIFELPLITEERGVCIAGECGFELGCVSEVTIEIANENGVQVLQQQCVKDGWVRDTEYYRLLKEEGYRNAEVMLE